MKKNGFRLVICLDVLGVDDLQSAYEQAYRALNKLPGDRFGWESTDEAYDNDGDGHALDEDVVLDTYARALERLNDDIPA